MTVNKILGIALVAGVFIMPFIPLIISSGAFFPFIVGKNIAFRVLVEILLFVWIVLAFRDPAFRPKFSYIIASAAVFLIVLVLATAFGVNPSHSFWSNFERMEGLITHIHLFAYLIVISCVLSTKKLWKWFFHISLGVSVIIGLYALFQLFNVVQIFQGIGRLESTFGNSIYLAVYMLFHIFIAAYYLAGAKEENGKGLIFPTAVLLFGLNAIAVYILVLITGSESTAIPGILISVLGITFLADLLAVSYKAFIKNKNEKFNTYISRALYLLLILFFIFIMYNTETRGVILGFIGGLALTGVLTALMSRGKIRNTAIAGIVLIIILVGTFIAVKDTEFVRNADVLKRFASISLTERTVESRFIIWGMSIEGFKNKPLLGYGPGNYDVVFNEHYDPRLWRQEQWFDRAHNTIFDWLIAGGILGLLAYLSLFAIPVYYLWRNKDESIIKKNLLIGLFAAYFFQGLFAFDNVTSYILFYSVLGFVNVNYCIEKESIFKRTLEKVKEKLPHKRSIYDVIVVILVVAIFIPVVYFVNYKPAQANKTLLEAIRPRESAEESLADFERVFGYNTFADVEATEQLISMTLAAIRSPEVSDATKQKFVDLAISESQKRLEEEPTNARLHLFLSSLLSNIGAADLAIDHLNTARELSPNKQSILFQLADIYVVKGDVDLALESLKRAYELDHSYNEASVNFAVMAIISNREDVFPELAKPFNESSIPPDTRLVNAYSAVDNYSKVIEVWKAIIESAEARESGELLPEDAQNHVSLAAAYLKNGQRAESIEELERAIEINPAFKDQATILINEIKAGRNPIQE